MRHSLGLRWKIYLLIFALLDIGNLAALFDKESLAYSYYHALMAFNPEYVISYLLNIASAVVGALAILPLSLYIFRVPLLGKKLWQGFFFLRLAFDFTGHAYEVNFMKSIFYSSFKYGIMAATLLLLLLLPSYLAVFRYAFRKKIILNR